MAEVAPRLATGVPGLDTVLGGGLSRRALAFIVGTPGAGKTILGSQVVFAAVARGDTVLVLTSFSEGSVKLLEHLRPFTFFDGQQIGARVQLFAMETLLGVEPEAVVTTLTRAIGDSGARLVLLDGFQGIADLFDDRRTVRRILARLADLLTYVDVTLLITLQGDGRDPDLAQDLTTADLVIGLEYRTDGLRHRRHLEVIKHRGQAPLPGLHPYTITAAGHTVFPRLEARSLPTPGPRRSGRSPFGLAELDALLGGGLTRRTTTVLAGAPGVGKTTLGLTWALADAEAVRGTVFFSFGERREELEDKAQAFGLDLDGAVASGALTLMRMAPSEISPDLVATRLLDALTPTTERLVLDDMTGLVRALGTRAPDYLAALAEQLYARGLTSLLLYEIDAFTGFGFDLARTPLSLFAHNVMVAQQVVTDGRLHRLVAVLKMRFSDHDRTVRELVLDPGGIRVLARAETEAGVLEAGTPHDGVAAPNAGSEGEPGPTT